MENGDPLYAGRPNVGLSVHRPSKAQRSRDRRPRDELPPSHVLTLKAPPVRYNVCYTVFV
jgi:hypothetical protein